VMVVPHRPAVLTAKILSTIDIFSNGRLTLGIGAGWLKEEFEALDAPDFAARGKVTDEYILAARELWTAAEPCFQGEHVAFDKISFEPKPLQPGGPPIWVGGESGPALRRTARLGDAWYPIGTNPAFPLDSLARYKAAVAKLRRLTAEAGRDPAAVGLSLRVQKFGAELPALAGDGDRHLFSGSAAQIVEDIQALRAMGVSAIDFNFLGSTVEKVLAQMESFRATVMERT